MKLSARNQLGGTIKRLVPGAVNTEITLEIGNGVDWRVTADAPLSLSHENTYAQMYEFDWSNG